MCKAPKPPKPKAPDKPEWLRNPYLDASVGGSATVNQLRAGRSSLRIDLGSGLGIRSAQPAPAPAPAPAAIAPPMPGRTATRRGSRGIRYIEP